MNSLNDEKIASTLTRLQKEAAGDSQRWSNDETTTSDSMIRMGDLYLSINEEEGKLLYLLARSSQAQSIVEFGASYGISTIYLGAAARDNHGHLTTTEVHPKKCTALQKNLQSAGLTDIVKLLEGDAQETLSDIDGPIDFVFLDGWKGLYLPVLEILKPKLATGALILADNIGHRAAQDYCDAVRSTDSGFISTTVGKQELTFYSG